MAPKTPNAAVGADVAYCLVKMTETPGQTVIQSAQIKDGASGKVRTNLDLTGATGSGTTLNGAGGAPNRDFSIDVAARTCTTGGQTTMIYEQDGPPRGGMPPSISEPIFPAAAPAPRR